MVEIPLKGISELLRQASLGKLINGLIHNINGPMQNIGLDIEMTHFQLSGDIKDDNDLITNMRSRIKRIEQEYNRLWNMIKTVSLRLDHNLASYNHLNFNNFIEEELDFQKANLYFKHNVETELNLLKNPPLLENLPNNFFLSLSCLLQAIIEELENRKIKSWHIEADIKDSTLEMMINTGKGNLSKDFFQLLNHDFSKGIPEYINQDMGTIFALIMFESEGTNINCKNDKTRSVIRLIVPINA